VAGNAAQGSDPVDGHGPSGDVKAQGFQILEKGDTIVFTGKSDMLLRGATPAVDKTMPAALPGPVAASAARAAAEAKPMLAAARPSPAPRRQAAVARRTAPQAGKTTAHVKPAARLKPAVAKPAPAKKT